MRFSNCKAKEYPFRLQALTEYNTNTNSSSVMVWSDFWNSPDRIRKAKELLVAYYRVLFSKIFCTYLAISASATSLSETKNWPYRACLYNQAGDFLEYNGELKTFGTDFKAIDDFFPNASELLAQQKLGLVVIESKYDLAIVQLTKHRASGACAIEHFLPAPTELENEKLVYPCGS